MQPSIDKLRKFLKLEIERGYDNRAVVGGLERIIPTWEAEARAENISEETVQQVKRIISSYAIASGDRPAILKNLWGVLANLTDTSPELPILKKQPRRPEKKPRFEKQSETSIPRSNNNFVPRPVLGQKIGLNAPLTVIQGIGTRNAQTLASIGIHTLGDLLYYFPRRYDDYSQLKPIHRLFYGDEVTVIGAITSLHARPIRGGASQLVEAMLTDGTGSLRLTWFNQVWIANRLKPDMQIVVSGKIDQYLGHLMMNNPEWEQLDQDQLHTNRIVPIYPLTASITQKWLRRIMYQTTTYWAAQVEDFIPDNIRADYGLEDLKTALREIHFPTSQESLRSARERLAFDEILCLQLGVLNQKRTWKNATAVAFQSSEETFTAWQSQLPYTLTTAQQSALHAIREDLQSGQPMNRLLQGDVGSGKTVVAALGLAVVLSSGAQAALMAPTGILAEQHYRSLTRLLAEEGNGIAILKPEQIVLLTGSTKDSEKERIRSGLADGSVLLVIGTHALIEDPIVFRNLQMVVVDEQHRFGVEQRAALRSKGTNPHLLVMTATPIPRSLALSIYGDLDLTVMDEFPAGRQQIDTILLYPREREMAYTRIKAEIEEGRQAFIIYPLVEKGDSSEARENDDEARAAVEESERLQKEVFPHARLGLLHGRMKADEKDRVMRQFRDRELDILVSTSVVEVGLDIPNATIMMIEGANRFGLSQLHQFRGRVGRGSYKSYCLLIPEKENDVENERLKAMVGTNDGFVLAEKDLDQRGPGDFLGTRQSGFNDLRLASLTDVRLIEKAREAAEKIFESDPDLSQSEHQTLVEVVNRFWNPGRGDIS